MYALGVRAWGGAERPCDDVDMSHGFLGRSMRKIALVALFALAVLASPVALPIRMLIARRQRPVQTTEQVVRATPAAEATLPATL